jgi:hypothetical protein
MISKEPKVHLFLFSEIPDTATKRNDATPRSHGTHDAAALPEPGHGRWNGRHGWHGRNGADDGWHGRYGPGRYGRNHHGAARINQNARSCRLRADDADDGRNGRPEMT